VLLSLTAPIKDGAVLSMVNDVRGTSPSYKLPARSYPPTYTSAVALPAGTVQSYVQVIPSPLFVIAFPPTTVLVMVILGTSAMASLNSAVIVTVSFCFTILSASLSVRETVGTVLSIVNISSSAPAYAFPAISLPATVTVATASPAGTVQLYVQVTLSPLFVIAAPATPPLAMVMVGVFAIASLNCAVIVTVSFCFTMLSASSSVRTTVGAVLSTVKL